jgi:hypothetical protein
MRRFFVLAVLLAAAAVTSAATAARPSFQPPPPTPPLPFTDTTCGFSVTVSFPIFGQTAKSFSDGTTIVTGPLAVEFSANGKSVTFHIAGPVFVAADGTVIGRGVGAGPVSTPDGTILAFAAGPALIPASGIAVLQHGTILLNVCEALAT